MTLYEIDRQTEQAIGDLLASVNEETGEVDEKLAAKIDELQATRTEKLDNIGAYIKNLVAEKDALEAEAKNLENRAKIKGNEIERLKTYVAQSLIGCGETKLETTRARFSFRRSEAVEIDGDVPEEYLVETVTKKPDKDAIKTAIMEGKVVEGAHIVVRQNLQIK